MAKNYANYVRIRRFIFDSACAGLSLSPRLSYMRGTERTNAIRSYSPLMTNLSTRRYLEYMHMLFTVKFYKNKITKNDRVFI